MKKIYSAVIFSLLLLSSCNSGTILPNATGTAFEVLVVIDEANWKNPCGKAIFDMLNEDVPYVPQSEPMFKISHVPHAEFDAYLQPARNLIIVNISKKYSQPKVTFAKEQWSKKQAIILLNSPTQEGIMDLVKKEKDKMTAFFVKMERERYQTYLKTIQNKTVQNQIYEQFGVQMLIPSDMTQSKIGKDFFWVSNGGAKARQDIIVYSYPYTDVKDFTVERLIQKRDSVLKQNVPGPEEGSYMGTETCYEKPFMREIWVNEAYCAEIHGLWKVYEGSLMGGPFVSHSRLDEINQRIITVEGFVFAPSQEKRNFIRQMEALVYSAKMPQEVNEVIVVNKKKKN